MGIVFKNNAKTTLSSAVNNSTTTIPVTEGSVFPAVNLSGAGTFFLLTLDDETNNEIVKVTSCSGASGNINLTVIRAQESTTARAFSSGDKAELRFTSGTIDEIRSDNTVHTNIFTTANNSTTDFTLSDEVANENDLVVFIDGVFQAHNTFSVSGTTLTLATAPASGRVVTVYSIKGSRSASNVALATMTGDNSDTTLTLPVEPINENSVQVFFDGVYQSKSNFSISGTTLTFSTAPPTGVAVEALVFTKLAINTSSILSDTDADTKVQVEESSDEDKIRFTTGGTERAIIDSTGVGIGTSSPSRQLTVFHATNATHDIKTSDANLLFNQSGHNSFLGNSSTSGYLQLFTNNGNSVVNMLANGNVGIGTTSPSGNLHIVSAGDGLVLSRSGYDTYSLQHSTGIGMSIFNVTDSRHEMHFKGDANNTVLIGGTTDNINNLDGIMFRKSGNRGQMFCSGDASTIDETYFVYDNTNSEYEFFVSYHGTVYYRTLSQLSDERKKDNIADITLGLDAIKELRPVSFDWKNSKGNNQLGFIAQEVETTSLKQLVGTYKDENIEDCKSLNKDGMIPVLVKAIQEQQTIIDDLKSRIEKLEE